MKQLLQKLERIGFPRDICERIRERFDGDEDGMRNYVRFCIALFGKYHERLD